MLPFAFWKPAGAAVYNPATLPLSLWSRGSYAGAPWAANASAGASLANGDITAGTAPGTGTAQNGYTPADFNGTTNVLANATADTTLFTTTALSIVVLFYADTVAAPTGNVYDDAPFYRDLDGYQGATITSSGFGGFIYDGGYKSQVIACGTGAYHLGMVTCDGANLTVQVDSSGTLSTACGAMVHGGKTGVFGQGYGGTHYFDGRIMEIMLAASVLSGTDYTNIKSYVNSRYALAL